MIQIDANPAHLMQLMNVAVAVPERPDFPGERNQNLILPHSNFRFQVTIAHHMVTVSSRDEISLTIKYSSSTSTFHVAFSNFTCILRHSRLNMDQSFWCRIHIRISVFGRELCCLALRLSGWFRVLVVWVVSSTRKLKCAIPPVHFAEPLITLWSHG